jgi:hypothetical protein
VPDPHGFRATASAEALAAAMAGWLEGVVQGEYFEQRLTAEAEAYAKERVQAERRVGFDAPPGRRVTNG